MKATVTYPTFVHDLVEGVSKNVHHLRESLARRGVDAVDDSPRVEMGAMNKRSVYVKQGVAAYRRVRAALDAPDVDVVHYHVSIPGMAAWAALARMRARRDKPLVLHMWNPWYDAKDAHARAGLDTAYHCAFNSPWTTLPFLGAFDRIVVSSEYQRAQLARFGHVDVDVIGNGVDLGTYQPPPRASTRTNARRELGLPVDKTLLLYYGHLTPWKGVGVLVEALPRALAGNPDAHVVVARTHYGAQEARLRKRMHELGVLDRVHFLGVCDVALLLQAVDAGVVPATAAVGTACHPNVVLEYQSAGVPIVASRVGSIPEAVEDGRTGLLARPGDAEDLGAKIHALLSDDALRARFSIQARKHAQRAFAWDDVAQRYERAYERALEAVSTRSRHGGRAHAPRSRRARA